MSPTRQSTKQKSRLVVTPGGPRPVENVHFVAPGEIVRQNAGGTLTIVRREAMQPGVRSLQMSEEMVLTPGGYRPKTKVHFVGPNHAIQLVNGRLHKLDMSGKLLL